MKDKLEHAICRAAIEWERTGEDAEDGLRAAVKAYMEFLIEYALPVGNEPKSEPSDPGVVIRR